ncbi:hypothetical protein STHU_18740 [Allostella humosa]|nr:hypothetical protein STHU_18740 [Stella humosa]
MIEGRCKPALAQRSWRCRIRVGLPDDPIELRHERLARRGILRAAKPGIAGRIGMPATIPMRYAAEARERG